MTQIESIQQPSRFKNVVISLVLWKSPLKVAMRCGGATTAYRVGTTTKVKYTTAARPVQNETEGERERERVSVIESIDMQDST